MTTLPLRHTIGMFALICVAATSLYVIGLGVWLVSILSAPDWCQHMPNGGHTDAPFADGCLTLLASQIGALSIVAYIVVGIVALCLLTLIVIVIAGGRLSVRASRDGISADIGANDLEMPEPGPSPQPLPPRSL